jgi:hypothetical protein
MTLRPPSQPEFHRRRAEFEMEKALSAGKMSVSLIHLELAKIHRQRREQLMIEERAAVPDGAAASICRTDKEGYVLSRNLKVCLAFVTVLLLVFAYASLGAQPTISELEQVR